MQVHCKAIIGHSGKGITFFRVLVKNLCPMLTKSRQKGAKR